jgi:hypothetical protein
MCASRAPPRISSVLDGLAYQQNKNMSTTAIRARCFAAVLLSPLAAAQDNVPTGHEESGDLPTRHNEATVAQPQAEMAAGTLTAEELTKE